MSVGDWITLVAGIAAIGISAGIEVIRERRERLPPIPEVMLSDCPRAARRRERERELREWEQAFAAVSTEKSPSRREARDGIATFEAFKRGLEQGKRDVNAFNAPSAEKPL